MEEKHGIEPNYLSMEVQMDELMKNCSQCGVSMPESSMFCPSCGAKQTVVESVADQSVDAEPIAPQAPQPVYEPAPAFTPPPVIPVQQTPSAPYQPQPYVQQPIQTNTLPVKPKKKFPWLYLALTLILLIGIGVVGYLYFNGNIVDIDDITFADDIFSMLVLGLSGILVIWNISMRILVAGLKRKTVVDVLQFLTLAIVAYLLVEIVIAGPVYSFTTDIINDLFENVLKYTIS
jgi:hypothetical protein